ncbi:hypothetical protein CSA37_00720 [Candidatus Fermentibacteria bacterium]|nr:MAG: hypothetical protein CSA37_00720 [Candidatus Fermentibacteria bacterium]
MPLFISNVKPQYDQMIPNLCIHRQKINSVRNSSAQYSSAMRTVCLNTCPSAVKSQTAYNSRNTILHLV